MRMMVQKLGTQYHDLLRQANESNLILQDYIAADAVPAQTAATETSRAHQLSAEAATSSGALIAAAPATSGAMASC